MTSDARKGSATEFSFVVRPADIGTEPARYSLEASPEERAALAARFDLVDIESLNAELRVEWLRGRQFLRLSGRIRAVVVQRCVVTLQPVRKEIDEPFEILFTAERWPGDEGTVELDDVEPLAGETLDIAEVAAEEMALMLDPYPRAPDANLERAAFGPPGSESNGENRPSAGGNRPFEVLATLKRNK